MIRYISVIRTRIGTKPAAISLCREFCAQREQPANTENLLASVGFFSTILIASSIECKDCEITEFERLTNEMGISRNTSKFCAYTS